MEIDEITQKRLNKFIESCLQENLHNRNSEVKTFASGAYHGIQKTLRIIGIDVDDEGKIKKEEE